MKLRAGFTLIELSIVLVIIALIVGGILTGREMIRVAETQRQITQIEQLRQATNAFRVKYNCLPGDCARAASFGFPARGSYKGQGDGDGMLEGNYINADWSYGGMVQVAGENPMFWIDLSQAGLIDTIFNTASSTTGDGNAQISGDALGQWFPRAKIPNNHIIVFGGTGGALGYISFVGMGPNYFLMEEVTLLGNNFAGSINSSRSIPVDVAYNIDTKLDDGMPTSGKVLGLTASTAIGYVEANGPPTNLATNAGSGRCFDNNAQAGVTMTYSKYNGSARNCNLAFAF